MTRTDSRVKPLVKYAVPAYPTGAEIGSGDLSRVPSRWAGLKSVATTIGAAAMTLKALALEAQDAVKPSAAAPVAAVPDARPPKTVEAKNVTEVCPLPLEAVAGGGAGAFGCVAMNPPVMLPEGEALDIIEKEFAKRNIKLVDSAVLDGVEMVKKGWCPTGDEKRRIRSCESVVPPREKRRCLFDFASSDGSVLVEFVSRKDQGKWVLDPYAGSTVSCVATRYAAEEMVKGVSKRTEGKPVRVGIFYDPCACVPEGWRPTIPEGTDPEKVWYVKDEQRTAKGLEISRKQLTAQIEAFFDFLAKHPAK